jgi:hypothetical protein
VGHYLQQLAPGFIAWKKANRYRSAEPLFGDLGYMATRSPTRGVVDRFNSLCRRLSGKTPWEQCQVLAGDLLVFLRGENVHRAARCGIVDGIVRGPVPTCVEPDTDPGQAAADRSACSPSFSPMPPVKTIKSTPSSAAIIAATCLRTE